MPFPNLRLSTTPCMAGEHGVWASSCCMQGPQAVCDPTWWGLQGSRPEEPFPDPCARSTTRRVGSKDWAGHHIDKPGTPFSRPCRAPKLLSDSPNRPRNVTSVSSARLRAQDSGQKQKYQGRAQLDIRALERSSMISVGTWPSGVLDLQDQDVKERGCLVSAVKATTAPMKGHRRRQPHAWRRPASGTRFEFKPSPCLCCWQQELEDPMKRLETAAPNHMYHAAAPQAVAASGDQTVTARPARRSTLDFCVIISRSSSPSARRHGEPVGTRE